MFCTVVGGFRVSTGIAMSFWHELFVAPVLVAPDLAKNIPMFICVDCMFPTAASLRWCFTPAAWLVKAASPMLRKLNMSYTLRCVCHLHVATILCTVATWATVHWKHNRPLWMRRKTAAVNLRRQAYLLVHPTNQIKHGVASSSLSAQISLKYRESRELWRQPIYSYDDFSLVGTMYRQH